MLTEHAEAVHSKIVNQIKHFWDSLCDFLLKLANNFENVVVSKNGIHSNDNLPHDNENIFLNFNVD
jgi:hypothetical protein